MRTAVAALALVALALVSSCRSATGPHLEVVGADQLAVAPDDALCRRPDRSFRVPTITAAAMNAEGTSLHVDLANFKRGTLGRDWTFSIRLGDGNVEWVIGPGLDDYLTWRRDPAWPRHRLMVTHVLAPDCPFDRSSSGATLTVGGSGVDIDGISPSVAHVGAVNIYSRAGLRDPWVASGFCSWSSHIPPVPVQVFTFERPAPEADQVADDATARSLHHLRASAP